MSIRLPPKLQRWQVTGLCCVLVAVTFAVFGRTLAHGFIDYDDGPYVYENPVVSRGLTLKGIVWSLTFAKIGHWHPLTWLSHMADCQVFGLWAGGHHLTNVALHAAAAGFLFLALLEMTGAVWRSAFVAAVFAVHPLRAESVAWIAERKDVLSGVFFMLTLWAYARYARRPSRGRYAMVAAWFGLGLLSKDTLVTLPFVLLLLDWWPLRRAEPRKFSGLVMEKMPLFLLSIGSCVATMLAPEKSLDVEHVPFLERVGNAVVSYGVYLKQQVYPAGLAIPYPCPPNGQPLWKVALVFALLAAISIFVLTFLKTRPYLLVGWLWYLGMLVPMIGLVQISYYSHADRYTYLPGIGLALAGTWAVADWSSRWKLSQPVLGGLMVATIGTLMTCAWVQVGYWKDSVTLWTHSLACNADNYYAHYNLGEVLDQQGQANEAIAQYRQALQRHPAYEGAQNNLGLVLLRLGRVDEAIPCFQKAIQIKSSYPEPRINLGNAFLQQGKTDEAIAQYQKAAELDPDDPTSRNGLGNALLQKGKVDDAIAQYQAALKLQPDNAVCHNNLGLALLRRGNVDEAIVHFQQALQYRPDYADPCLYLGGIFLQTGKFDDAILYFQKALQIKPNDAKIHLNLGNALVQKGDVRDAISHFEQAQQLQPGDPAVQNNLAWLLATCADASLRNGDKAVDLARRANQLTGEGNPMVLRTLAAALAETGRFSDAVQTIQKAIERAKSAGRQDMVTQFDTELQRYQANLPFHP